ncbi:hypothetical protein [Streptomyces sp. NBC_00439]|uniref:hypothetical protein n=1 Tax=Streptomyces sp. NBC_00439 TaxID=2903650 RepID=UPI00224DE5EB|nr:hypothetical protein [Streptomyces sp. NBC_00439]MCX5106969.1 hypothetical protein [Streptomyces sp. NBC_00439]
MEIVISEGRVSASTSEIDSPHAVRARSIANYLPRPELLREASIVHDLDEKTTSIRFETKAGPIRVMLPVESGFEFLVIHDSETGPRVLGSIKGSSLSARVIAFRISEFLRTRGLK